MSSTRVGNSRRGLRKEELSSKARQVLSRGVRRRGFVHDFEGRSVEVGANLTFSRPSGHEADVVVNGHGIAGARGEAEDVVCFDVGTALDEGVADLLELIGVVGRIEASRPEGCNEHAREPRWVFFERRGPQGTVGMVLLASTHHTTGNSERFVARLEVREPEAEEISGFRRNLAQRALHDPLELHGRAKPKAANELEAPDADAGGAGWLRRVLDGSAAA